MILGSWDLEILRNFKYGYMINTSLSKITCGLMERICLEDSIMVAQDKFSSRSNFPVLCFIII